MNNINYLRSFLFAPADQPKKIEKSFFAGADAVIYDLEDAVLDENKSEARTILINKLIELIDELEKSKQNEFKAPKIFIRINHLKSIHWHDDIKAITNSRVIKHIYGIVVPKFEDVEQIFCVGTELQVAEIENNLEPKTIKIIAITTETPTGVLQQSNLIGLKTMLPRLIGLAWGGEDLAAELGATNNKDEFGNYTSPFMLARNLTLFTAKALGVMAIDTVFVDYSNSEKLAHETIEAKRDGFDAKMAIHPNQIEIINNTFQPTEYEVNKAKQIVELFENNNNNGVLSLDGKMLDKPHLVKAKKILQIYENFRSA